MKAAIYIACHKPSRVVSNRAIRPIRVGFDKESVKGVELSDSIGDSIAHKNASYCELTAQYWAWKNDADSDYVGMMHYRRYFDFSNSNEHVCDTWGVVNRPRFGYFFSESFGLDSESVENFLSTCDIVLPHKWSVRDAGFDSIRSHYSSALGHYAKDLLVVRDVIKDRHPDYLSFYDDYLSSDEGYFTNMFVMRRDLFDAYSAWLFDVLSEAELRIDISKYDPVARRIFGYLSERLLNVWLKKVLSESPTLRVRCLNRVFVHNTDPVRIESNNIELAAPSATIAVASDNGYAPHLGAMIASVVANAKADSRLEFVVLDGGITPENRYSLMRIASCSGRNAVRFIDMKGEFDDCAVHMHFHQSTFYRLLLSELLPNRERVLYIDCDTIVLGDVVSLFGVDLKGNPLGAVFDYIMHHFCQTGVASMAEVGGMPSRDYLVSYVGMGESWSRYFQAGVIVFDLNKIRELELEPRMISELKKKRYWFLDQDVLNKFVEGRVEFLNPAWNVVNVGDQILAGLTDEQVREIRNSKLAPMLVHYAGYEAKPWVNEFAPMSGFYWQYLRLTPWYEEVRKALVAKSKVSVCAGPGDSSVGDVEADFMTLQRVRLENYHRMSKDPVISLYRKICKAFGRWPYDVKSGDEFSKISNYHRMTKDGFITSYRKMMRFFGLWSY